MLTAILHAPSSDVDINDYTTDPGSGRGDIQGDYGIDSF